MSKDLHSKAIIKCSGQIFCSALTSDGQILITGSSDRAIDVWDLKSHKLLYKIPNAHKNEISAIILRQSARQVLSGSQDFDIKLWNLLNGVCLYTFEEIHTNWIFTMSLSLDDKLLCSGSGDGSISLLNLEDHNKPSIYFHKHSGPKNSVYGAKISRDGLKVISGGADNRIKVWRIKDQKCLYTLDDVHAGSEKNEGSDAFDQGGLRSITLNSNDQIAITSGSTDFSIKIWNTNNLTKFNLARTIEAAHSDEIKCLQFIFSEQYLLTGSFDKSIKIWKIDSGDRLLNLENIHKGNINTLSYSIDEHDLYSGGEDKVIKLHDIKALLGEKYPGKKEKGLGSEAIIIEIKNKYSEREDYIKKHNPKKNCCQIF